MKNRIERAVETRTEWIRKAANAILEALSYDTTKDVGEQFLIRHQEDLNKPQKKKKPNIRKNKKI